MIMRKIFFVCALLFVCGAVVMVAQPKKRRVTTTNEVMKQGNERAAAVAAKGADRMSIMFPTRDAMPEDVVWRRDIYRVLVGLQAIRQRKFLNDNYSYDENISVRWAVGSCCGYVLLVIVYPFAFDHFHWINESVYCLLVFVASYLTTCLKQKLRVKMKHYLSISQTL